jgi:hypothetical protein
VAGIEKDVTGTIRVSGNSSDKYLKNFDKIFRKRGKKNAKEKKRDASTNK